MNRNIRKTLLFTFVFFLALPLLAQEEEPSSAAELAKELSNPNTTLGMMAFPIFL